MTSRRQRSWDRHAIMAEIRRRGGNLRQIAREAGLEKSACSAALIRPLPAAEAAIADYLGLTLNELWPDRYPTRSALKSRADYATAAASAASLNGEHDQTALSK